MFLPGNHGSVGIFRARGISLSSRAIDSFFYSPEAISLDAGIRDISSGIMVAVDQDYSVCRSTKLTHDGRRQPHGIVCSAWFWPYGSPEYQPPKKNAKK